MITIVNNLPKINPAFNPIYINAQSDEQTRPDFRYKVDIKDGDTGVIATKKVIGGNNIADVVSIDIAPMLYRLQYFGAWRFDVVGGEYIYYDANFTQPFSVVISESYDGILHDIKKIENVYTIPASFPSIKFAYWSYESIKATGAWLTNFEGFKVRANDKLTLSYFSPAAGVASFDYSFYDIDGNLLETVTKNNPYPAVKEDVLHIHAGFDEIKAFAGISDETAANVSNYEIKPANGQKMPFSVISEDIRFPGVRVHFLNEWGAVDSFLFSLAHRRGATIEKKKAKTGFANTAIRPGVFGAVNTPYSVKFTDSLKITSDFVSDNDSNALLEMFSSPIVSAEVEQSLFFPAPKGNKIILPCEIDVSSYDVKNSNLESLFNVELEVKISVDNSRQVL